MFSHSPGARWICTECGVVEPADVEPTHCPHCGDELFDMEQPEDERFSYDVMQLRRTQRLGLAGLISGLTSLVIVFGLIFSSELWIPIVFGDVGPLEKRSIEDAVVGFAEIGVYVGTAILFLPVSWLLRQRLPRSMRRAEFQVFSRHRADTIRWFTASPIILALLIFVVNVYAAVTDMTEPARRYGLRPAELLDGERGWTLLTSIFVHGDVMHLVGNLLGLLMLGVVIDLRLGHLKAMILALGAALVGGLAHAVFTPDPLVYVIGASGIVYGFAGANFVLVPDRPVVLGNSAGLFMKVPTWVYVVLIVAVMTGLQIWSDAPVAWIAHLGGFAFGAAFAFLFRDSPTPPVFERLEKRRRNRLAAFD